MSYQEQLEKVIERMSDEEIRQALYEICLIINRGKEEEKANMLKDIIGTVRERILKRM
ncbi:hypothetical protein PTHTG4_27490 [Parageobacillus thermoglucosidasius]|uniref:hypothetical protein n=1 Tax=Parageobacillus thermoglucosidasius TaxID=1426 RepID=UPI000FFAFBAE|nr:hypothetical protein [Parageobacillus thermoglucosidasius]GCD83685.1 hypothetical protein PTHTG4_27490 [Parageobacillus thermoglucosidasius]